MFLMTNHLDETFQTAYKEFHSTETALLRVHNDILCSLDQNKSVILLLLDLSAAFDTVDHAILISRLSNRFGVKGTALAWFKSYLTSRQQFVNVEGGMSSRRSLLRGVPHRSVLGPLLYRVYTAPIADISKKHDYYTICTLMTRNYIFPSIPIAVLILMRQSCVLSAVLKKLTFGCAKTY